MAEYPTSFTRRWKAIVDDLKASNERFGKYYIRSVDFTKTHKGDEEEHHGIMAGDHMNGDMSQNADYNDDNDNETERDPDAATTKLAPEAGAQNFVVEQNGSDATASDSRKSRTEKGAVAQLVSSWPMFTHRNSLNRDDAILRLAQQRMNRSEEQAMAKSLAQGTEGVGGDPEEDSMSWMRFSDEIGDIVPGLNLNDLDIDSTDHSVVSKRSPQKAKRGPMGKGRNMGKFGKARGRRAGPVRKKPGVLRTTQSARNVGNDDDSVELANRANPNLIPMNAQQSATLTMGGNYVQNEVEQDLDTVLKDIDLGYED